jgi:hypothetical protein
MRSFHRTDRGRLTLVALLLGGGGTALMFRPTPLWWFGGALVMAALTLAWRAYGDGLRQAADRLREPARIGPLRLVPADAIVEGGYYLVIVTVATVMLGNVALGDRPVMHDHAIHFVKAWQMHEHFLPRGRLIGWSHAWFAGYPAGYLYPIGTDLWVNAVHFFSLGLLTFSQAYGVAFWLFHVLTGVATYRFGRLVGGAHVGLLAGLLALTDLSEFRFGGWAYTIVYGVWPQSLSLAFALLAMCRLPALVEQRRLRDIGGFGVWMGLALLTHPVHLILIPLVFVVASVAAAFSREVRAAAGMLRVLMGCFLAFLVASVWLLPFLATRSHVFTMGVWWDTTYEMAKGIVDLDAFPGTLGLVIAFGVLALFIMFRTRRFILLFTALMATFIPFVCSSTFIDEFHLPAVLEPMSRVQFVRMSTMVKPFWFTLSAFAVVVLLRVSGRFVASRVEGETAAAPGSESHLRAAVLATVLGLVLVPIAVPALQALWSRHVNKYLVVESERPLRDERLRLLQWMKENLPRDGFYRIGIFSGHEHDFMDLATELNQPLYKRGFTPCSNFIYKMRSREPEVLKAVNLRYAVIKKPLPKEDFDLLKVFGELRVYRFKHWTPQPFEVIEGSGKVAVERFADEEIVLTAAAGSHGTLRLNVSHFPRWHAYRDGVPLPISLTGIPEEPETTGFMTVPLAPGRYRFVFERTAVDEAGLPLSLLALALAFVLALSDRRPRGLSWVRGPLIAMTGWAERLSGPAFGRLRVSLLAGATAILALSGVLLAEWQPPMVLSGLDAPPIKRLRFDFLERLHRARVALEFEDANRPCVRQKDRFVCPDENGDLQIDSYVASYPATIEEYTMVRCIRARPVEDALLSIIYPRVPAGDALVGYYGVEFEGRLLKKRRPVSFSIMVNGHKLYEELTIKDTLMHWFRIPIRERFGSRRVSVAFSVEAENVRKRHLCFYAQMVDF